MSKLKLAQKRNYFKFVITGMPKPIDTQVLTDIELVKWNQLLDLRKSLIANFEENSRKKGLNVPKVRCVYGYCKNKADKYLSNHNKLPICKKHKILEDEFHKKSN